MGSGYAVGGSVRMMDDGRSTNIPGKKEGKSTVSGLWRRLGGRFAGCSSADPSWCGRGRDISVGDPLPRRRASDVLGVITNRGGTMVITSQGV